MSSGFQIFRKIAPILLCIATVAPVVQAREIIRKGDTVIIPLRGEVSPALYLFLRRGIKLAESAGASAIVIEMNTYGGRLDAAEEITGALNRVTIPTYTFIDSNAGSAGALIALATKHIYMAPVSAIGAAAPVLSTGQDLPETERDKTISYFSALVRSMASRNGHNPDLGEAFMNKEKEVKIGDRVVHAKGSLLTLNAQEASEMINGHPLLADGIAQSIDDLAQKAKLSGQLVRLQPTGFEQFAFWITALAPLLLLLGIVCAYLEFKIPGATLPGVIAGICFVLFFLGHYLAGLAGWEAAVFFVLGVTLVLIEVLFFAHSTIIFGVVGAFLILASLFWAMIDRYPDQPLVPSTKMLLVPMLNLSIAIIASMIVIALLARYLPRTSFYRRFALMAANPSGPSFSAPREFVTSRSIAPGTQGLAVTTLRPSGKGRFGDQVVDVITAGEFISAETPIIVSQIDGMRVLVARSRTPA
ncbi:MAG: serine protease [Verrucomicrobia bacterium]|nr:MAG: serine protease [Verrucomicrobiota bacterium]